MRRLRIATADPGPHELQEAIEALTRGGVVAFPTETFYGLAADPRSSAAVARLYTIKGRGGDQALPLVAADERQVADHVGEMTALAARLARAFWPGALTLVIPASPALAREVHRSTGTIAVRVPAHRIARALAAHAGHALTSTSANFSGEPPATTPDEVAATFEHAIDVLIDAGRTPGGLPSTIVDVTGEVPVLVRAGAVPWERVLEFLH